MKDEGVVSLTLNRPEKLNALDVTMWRELGQAFNEADKDDDVNLIIISGAGRAFCAGDDIGELTAIGDVRKAWKFIMGEIWSTFSRILDVKKPVIAVVNGLAYGGGCELLLMCDIVIASQDAVFAIPEASLGAWPPVALAVGPCILGRKIVEMALTGESIGAEEAMKIGLVHKVVPSERLNGTISETIGKVKAASAPFSARLIRMTHMKLLKRLQIEDALKDLMILGLTDDLKEGSKAFLERRKPDFKGF